MQEKQNGFISFLENFTLGMIVLVLIQTFLEDFSVFMGFPIYTVNRIRLSAFIFDFFFTVEFLIRMISAVSKKKGIHYFFYRNGWIDLLASIPLLLLISGPEFMIQIFKINILNFGFINALGMLKVIKAIRVARILRLLRVLKVFGKIKNVSSVMAQRHISTISTIVISSIITFLVAISVLQTVNVLPSKYDELIKKEDSINKAFTKMYRLSNENDLKDMLKFLPKDFDSIIKLNKDGETIYRSENIYNEYYQFYKDQKDQEYVKSYNVILPDKLFITFFRYDYFKEEAFNNVINFIMIIFVLVIIIIIYTRHFALTVSDPIFVMRNGFEKRDYTYAVKIREHFKDDDIFVLANNYNIRWLPAKVRKLSEMKEEKSLLSFDDVFKASE